MDSGGAQNLFDLVEQHYALLYRYAFRLSGCAAEAEDLTQQAFLIAQTKLSQLREASRAKAWLCSIVRNSYLKEIRTRACAPTTTLENIAELASPTDAVSTFDHEQLQNVLNDLPEEFRSPIILFYFEEFSYKEIADHMGVPIGTIMSRLARAKAFLRQRLTEPDATTVQHDASLRRPDATS